MFGYAKSNLFLALKPIQVVSFGMFSHRRIIISRSVISELVVSLLIISVICGSMVRVSGQELTWRAREGLPVGSEVERYLRVLQLTGTAPLHSWALRSFAPSELVLALPVSTEHLWQSQIDFSLESPVGWELEWIQPKAGFISNSAYPFGENDGAIWAGKGLTAVFEGGGVLRYGPLHLRLAPEASWSENEYFDLAENGYSQSAAYWDDLHPGTIDKPQRFGEEAYVLNSVDRQAYLSALALATKLVVTCDSTSMISEAATSGKPIFVAHMTPKRNNYRFKIFFKLFKDMGIIRDLGTKVEDWSYDKINEAERIGKIIQSKIHH